MAGVRRLKAGGAMRSTMRRFPFAYMSTQAVAGEPALRSKYDVIIFAPIGHASTQSIIDGMPKYGNALPWQKTELTPNLGKLDSTPDMRIGPWL